VIAANEATCIYVLPRCSANTAASFPRWQSQYRITLTRAIVSCDNLAIGHRVEEAGGIR